MLLQGIMLLGLTVLVIAILLRWQLPAILGYLAAGIVLSELGYSLYGESSELRLLGELGLVFLLFSLGLEFSLPKLKSLRRAVFVLGPSQMLGTAAAFGLPLVLFGLDSKIALVLSLALAMSSTALVSKQLAAQRELNTRHGRNAIGVLLFQDLAAVPLLILVPALAVSDQGQITQHLLLAFAKGLTAAAVLVLIGRRILPPLFHWVSRTRSDELFVLVCLLVTLVAAAVTHELGLSMALGAFLAGTLLGESQFRHQIEAEIRPFRDVLMGLFFIGIGNLLTLSVLVDHTLVIMLALPLIILIKLLVVYLALRLMKERRREAIVSGMVLAQVGEFGFALLALASDTRLMDANTVSVALTVGIASMLLAPLALRHSNRLTDIVLRRRHKQDEDGDPLQVIEQAAQELNHHVIVCGFGRVGQLVVRFVEHEGYKALALDRDSQRVQEANQAGVRVFFGDASRPEILRACGVDRARMVVVCVDSAEHAELIVRRVRNLHPDLPVLVRTQDDSHLDELRESGATEVVPEILEGSLMLVSHVLVMLDVPVNKVLHRVQQARRARYKQLKGFFYGAGADMTSDSGKRPQQLHPVTLAPDSAGTGSNLGALNLEAMGVEVTSLRRAGIEHPYPANNELLRAGDTLVLMGYPEHIEAAEACLLSGNRRFSRF
ncbi:MAG TPA: cation:proton antiporter [Permianibacter sp.]|nr:cation:proton antiporter [Permianibacter sp.]